MKKIVLGSLADSYLENALKSGSQLAMAIYKSANYRKGILNTFLPEDVTEDQIRDLYAGGKIFSDVSKKIKKGVFGGIHGVAYQVTNAQDELINYLNKELVSIKNSFIIFENRSARPTDPSLEKETCLKLFNYEFNEVYFFVDGNSKEKLKDTISSSTELPYSLAFLFSEMNGISLVDNQKINVKEISNFIPYLQRIVVLGTYDGESYLIWEPIK